MLSTGTWTSRREGSQKSSPWYLSLHVRLILKTNPWLPGCTCRSGKKYHKKTEPPGGQRKGGKNIFSCQKPQKVKHGICHILWENDSLTCFVLCFPLWWIHSRVLFCRPSPPFSLIITADNGRKEGERKREKGGTITSRNASASLHRRKRKKARPIINPSKKEHFFARRLVAVWKLHFLKRAFLRQNPSRRRAPPCRLPSSFLPFLCDRNSLVSFHLFTISEKRPRRKKNSKWPGKTDRIAWKRTHTFQKTQGENVLPAFPSHVPFAIITLALKRGWGGQLLLFPPSKQKKTALISALSPSIQVYYCGLASETQPAP